MKFVLLRTNNLSKLIGLFVVLFATAFFLATPILLYASLIPLLTMLFGLLIDHPKDVKITRVGLKKMFGLARYWRFL